MKIFLVRHGQSFNNIKTQFSLKNAEDDMLTELGIQQARKTGIFLSKLEKIVNMIAAWCNGQLLAPFTVEGSCNRIVIETW